MGVGGRCRRKVQPASQHTHADAHHVPTWWWLRRGQRSELESLPWGAAVPVWETDVLAAVKPRYNGDTVGRGFCLWKASQGKRHLRWT